MQRQGMVVTIKQLRKQADELEKELRDINKDVGIHKTDEEIFNQECQIVIINKTKASDGWKMEE